MNVYYLVFLLTYHLTGAYNFYLDSTKGNERDAIKKVKNYIKGFQQVAFNTGMVSMITFYLLSWLINPSFAEFSQRKETYRFIASIGLLDIFRYSAHRLSHKFSWHLLNHYFIDPPGWLTAYTHSLDWVVGNLVVCSLPVWITGMHYYTTLFWIFLLTFSSVNKTKVREMHHQYPDTNYGIGLFMDKLLG